MGFMDFMFGKKESMQQVPTMTGGQTDLLNQLLGALQGGGEGLMGQGGQYLSDMLSGSPEAMQKFEAPYMRQFQEQTVPSVTERFSSLGSGSQGSSAFGQQMGAQAAGLSENLAAQRGQLQQGALSQLLGMGQMGLGAQPFGYFHKQPTQGFMQGMAPGIGAALGMGLTGGMSALPGMLGKLFQPKYGAWQNGQHYSI